MKEKQKENDDLKEKLVSAEKEIIDIGRELRQSESRSREYLQNKFDAEENLKKFTTENQMLLSKLQEYDAANKKFEDAFG